MAPTDRRERRKERERGAGVSAVPVTASFGFDIGAFARSAKQTSLPPRPSSRRNPVQTPRGANDSGQRLRSASIQRSSGRKHSKPSTDRNVTPHLGKRKRGSIHAQASEDDGELDELSPEAGLHVASVEKSRKVAGTVSPIHEEADNGPDELSFVEEGTISVRKVRTPNALAASNNSPLPARWVSSGGGQEKTPIAGRIGSMSISSRQGLVRRSKSTDPGPITPGMFLNGRPRVSSSSHFGPEFTTPSGVQNEGEDSEDELSPPQAVSSTPNIVGQAEQSMIQEDSNMDIDELSSPLQLTEARQTQASELVEPAKRQVPHMEIKLAKHGRTRKSNERDEYEAQEANQQASVTSPARQQLLQRREAELEERAPTPKPAKRGRPRRIIEDEEDEVQKTPAANKPRQTRRSAETEEADDEPDEISPEIERATQQPSKLIERTKEVVELSPDEESELEEMRLNSSPATKRMASKRIQRAEPISKKPPRKRRKPSGPKQVISVMRMKGSIVRGITVADTTRTIIEENIDHRLNRLAEKMHNAQDSARRKALKGEIMLSLSFRESLNEKLLDIQDANDVLSSNFRKAKIFKRANAELRKRILALQNNRHEVALELDEVQAAFDAEKEKIELRNKLSKNMFDIQAAIEVGRERARREGREDEGPEVPLSMLLESVSRDVGSYGGGLLASIKGFNGVLERAAGWLEGRA